MLIQSYILPHPPIALKELAGGEERKIPRTLAAFERVAKEIRDFKPETIIISSPHAPMYRDFFYMAFCDEITGSLASFGFPELNMKVSYDRGLSDQIAKLSEDLPLFYDKSFFHQIDHGAFVPLHFIRQYYQDFDLVLLGVSGLSSKDHFTFGRKIQEAIELLDRKIVYIASGDLSHVLKEDGPYGYRKEGEMFDRQVLKLLSKGDWEQILDFPVQLMQDASQCGMKSFQILAGVLDSYSTKSRFLSYENSFGVGYGAFAFDLPTDPYIHLAKRSIEKYLEDQTILPLPDHLPEEMLLRKAGSFVTLYKKGQLRGCIGTIEGYRENLGQEIIENAISAAFFDPRFPPLQGSEWKEIKLSVDILEEAEEISSLEDLNPKVYGVIVSKGGRKGLLLPNIEGVDTSRDQVAIALQKASILPEEEYSLQRFQVIRHEEDTM